MYPQFSNEDTEVLRIYPSVGPISDLLSHNLSGAAQVPGACLNRQMVLLYGCG